MAVQGALWLAKRLFLNLNFSFLNWISLLLISSSYPIVLTKLSGPHSDPTLPEKFLGYSRESNPGPLGWQSDVLTTIPNRRSHRVLGISNVCLLLCRVANLKANILKVKGMYRLSNIKKVYKHLKNLLIFSLNIAMCSEIVFLLYTKLL